MAERAPLTEQQFAKLVHELAATFGWRRYHTYRSKRSKPGFPDEVLVRDRVIYAELKSDTGKLSEAQKDWLDALELAGQECYVWRPQDLQEIAHTFARRVERITDPPNWPLADPIPVDHDLEVA